MRVSVKLEGGGREYFIHVIEEEVLEDDDFLDASHSRTFDQSELAGISR